MTITHASIIPLIGGLTLGCEKAFGSPPEFLVSYDAFRANDLHCVNRYPSSPYFVLDKGGKPFSSPDVVASTCPCAGLSMMHRAYGDDNPNNKWMGLAAEYVLSELRPSCYFGENAPALAGKIGKNVRENLYSIGRKNGYSMSMYRTKSLLHGSPQVRERSFYFFWRGERVPLLNWFNTPHEKIEDVILFAGSSNFQREPINPKTPSEDPWYRYVLEVVHSGRTHEEHCRLIEPQSARGNDALSYIETMGHEYVPGVRDWMASHGFERQAKSCDRMHEKLKSGGNVYRRGVVVPKDFIGAFVAHYPTMLTHPVQDRFIDYREAMAIMGMPLDFELVGASPKNANMICQNVPVQTATDMATEVREALEERRDWVRPDHILFQYNHSHKVVGREESTLESFLS